jgi:surfactin synthase thioesterase subunit
MSITLRHARRCANKTKEPLALPERAQRRAPLDCPLLVVAGTDDEISHTPEDLTAWALETSGSFSIAMFEGNHFFIDQRQAAVVSLVVDSLSRAVRSPD